MRSTTRRGGGTWSQLAARRHRLVRVNRCWAPPPKQQQPLSWFSSTSSTTSHGTDSRGVARAVNNSNQRNNDNGNIVVTIEKRGARRSGVSSSPSLSATTTSTTQATPVTTPPKTTTTTTIPTAPTAIQNVSSRSLHDEIRKALNMPVYSNNHNNNGATATTTSTTRHSGDMKIATISNSPRDHRHKPRRNAAAAEVSNPSFLATTTTTARSADGATSFSFGDATLTATATSPSSSSSAHMADIFDIPDLPPPQHHVSKTSLNHADNDDGNDNAAWEHYVKMMETIVQNDPKFRRQHTAKPIPVEKANAVLAFLLKRSDVAADHHAAAAAAAGESSNDPTMTTMTTTTREFLHRALEQHGGGGGGVDGDHGNKTTNNNNFAQDICNQRRIFMQEYNFDKKQYDMLEGALTQMTNMCARMAHGLPAPVFWRKSLEAAISYKKLLQNLLHVAATCTTTSNSSSSSSSRRRRSAKTKYTTMSILDILNDHDNSNNSSSSNEEENAETTAVDLVDMVDEIAIYHDLLHDATEQSINVRIRLLVAQGKAQQAVRLLHQNANDDNDDDGTSIKKKNPVILRLRSYTPVLSLLLDQGDLKGAIRLYREMRRIPSVHLDADTYIQLLAGIAERGGFRPDYVPHAVAAEENDNYNDDNINDAAICFGSNLVDELASEMAEEVIEISATAARRLYNALSDGFPNVEGLEKAKSLLAPLPVNNTPASSDQSIIASRVIIGRHTGTCPRTGIKLVLKGLTTKQSQQLQESIMTLARESQQNKPRHQPASQKENHNNNHVVDVAEAAVQNLQRFYRWLDTRRGEPYTVIVDGPNVGYFMQNFENGRFSYHQIQFVVDYLERLGERPLVILPRKYLLDFFNVSFFGARSTSADADDGGPGVGGGGSPKRQRLTSAEKRIRDELSQSGKIAAVPAGHHDDYFWILASTTKQTASTGGQDLYVSPSTTTTLEDQSDNNTTQHSRWPGTRPVVLTNDNMRDHKLGLLEPMLFRRWYSNYIVNYNFAAFVGSECTHPDIGFHPADFFSREIQGNRRIDDDNDDDGSSSMVWHFPIADKVDEWFCICIRRPPTK
jgi:hypothetical protein